MPESNSSPGTPFRRRQSPSEADTTIALMHKAIDVARLQFKRIRKDLDDYYHLVGSNGSVRVFDGKANPENVSKSREVRTALFADVHFLLISFHEMDRLLSRMKTIFPREAELANLRNKYRPVLKRCAEFRSLMEHIDGKDAEDLGTLADTEFSLNGRTLDVGSRFEKIAEGLFCELMSTWARISERQRKIRELISRAPTAS